MERLYAFLDEELAESDVAEMRAHLVECAGCEDNLVFEQRFLDHIRDSYTSGRAPEELRERIVVRLHEPPAAAT
ncbi:MAG: zf-HC2 domain-containing protein [Chloroflexota bacterium]|nr:zf-HC2 domain-containing protein [Chloroflexota bacterium]